MRTYTAKHNKLDDAELRVRKIVQHYVLIAANSGLRVGEQRQLRWSDVQIERGDDETKWAALELMLGTSSSVVALAKKMAMPETKTVTRTVAVPTTKVVTQQPQQQTTPKDTERTDFTPIRPQPPLPNQQDDRDKR